MKSKAAKIYYALVYGLMIVAVWGTFLLILAARVR